MEQEDGIDEKIEEKVEPNIEQKTNIETSPPELKSGGKVFLWLMLLILAAAIVFGAYWYFFKPETKEIEKNTEESAKTAPTAENWTRSSIYLFKNVTSVDTHKLSDGTYRMYMMKDGKIVYLDSEDAKNFSDPVSTGIKEDDGMFISNPAALEIKADNWIMIYEQQPVQKKGAQESEPGTNNQRNLYLATSKDGKTFEKTGVAIDSSKADNFFASVPDLVKTDDGKIRLYYVSGGEAIGSAISSDGLSWTRESGYRLENKAVDPDVIKKDDTWIMYYSVLTGPDNRLYKATSTDGLKWSGKEEVVKPLNSNSSVVDPDVVNISTNQYRMFFGEALAGDSTVPGEIDLYYADLK